MIYLSGSYTREEDEKIYRVEVKIIHENTFLIAQILEANVGRIWQEEKLISEWKERPYDLLKIKNNQVCRHKDTDELSSLDIAQSILFNMIILKTKTIFIKNTRTLFKNLVLKSNVGALFQATVTFPSNWIEFSNISSKSPWRPRIWNLTFIEESLSIVLFKWRKSEKVKVNLSLRRCSISDRCMWPNSPFFPLSLKKTRRQVFRQL